ncbi:SMR family transporter [Actinomadura nitritigenes]|uniref:SMR family transporter n=1 Tax=Actinomadura nitritigenes TaxID=134602 RepID=UPI003D8B2B6D
MAAAVWLLAQAMRTLPVGTAYAVFTGPRHRLRVTRSAGGEGGRRPRSGRGHRGEQGQGLLVR